MSKLLIRKENHQDQASRLQNKYILYRNMRKLFRLMILLLDWIIIMFLLRKIKGCLQKQIIFDFHNKKGCFQRSKRGGLDLIFIQNKETILHIQFFICFIILIYSLSMSLAYHWAIKLKIKTMA